jgi:hypothetical protein
MLVSYILCAILTSSCHITQKSKYTIKKVSFHKSKQVALLICEWYKNWIKIYKECARGNEAYKV